MQLPGRRQLGLVAQQVESLLPELVDVGAMGRLWQQGRAEFVIFGVTIIGVVFVDLFAGILAGLATAVLKIVWTFSRLEIHREESQGGDAVLACRHDLGGGLSGGDEGDAGPAEKVAAEIRAAGGEAVSNSDSVTDMTVATAISPSFPTTGFLTPAPTARIAPCGGLITASKLSMPRTAPSMVSCSTSSAACTSPPVRRWA